MSREIVRVDEFAPVTTPYSYAVRAGNVVATSAQPGLDRDYQPVGSTPGRLDVPAQAARALANLRLTLQAVGSDLDEVAKSNVWLSDLRNLTPVEDALAAAYGQPGPAAALVGCLLVNPSWTLAPEAFALAGTRPEVLARSRDGRARCVRAGNFLFTSTITACDDGRPYDRESMREQTRAIFEQVGELLSAGGAGFADVIKVHGTFPSMAGWAAYNEAWCEFFQEPFPARASIGGALPHLGALVGVQVIAATGLPRTTVEAAVRSPFHRPGPVGPGVVTSAALPPAVAPHSQGVRVGDLVYVMGHMSAALDAPVAHRGDVRAQCTRALENIRTVLEAVGGCVEDIVKCNVSLADPRLYAGYNEAYAAFFKPPYPARTTATGSLAQEGMLIEIEPIAVIGASKSATYVLGREA